MSKVGVFKPFRGTASALANEVLEDGEIAFEIPSTGIGTDSGAIKMGDGINKYSDLMYYMKSGGPEPPTPGGYSSGTTEADLLNNLNYLDQEQIGKIYYIQAYYHNSSQYSEGTPTISTGMPYMVIGKNHDGTTGTVDLMSLVPADYRKFNDNSNSWTYGKYSTSKIYSWLSNTCPNGYSSNIQAKMINMTERWREATGNATGTMQSRQTKCKLLNPVELFGYSSAATTWTWEYANSSDHKTDFASPTGDKYGSLYPIWTGSISALPDRRGFHDKEMSTATAVWTNSWLALHSSQSYAYCFYVSSDGSCDSGFVNGTRGVAPVIRLSNNDGWEYNSGNDEEALLHNIEHPESENIGKIYYIQSHYNGGTTTENNAIVGDAVPYKVIGINHEGTQDTIDLQAMTAVNYLKHGSSPSATWTYNSNDPIYTYLSDGGSYQSSLSSSVRKCLQTMTERWRTDNGNTSSTTSGSSPASSRYTKSKLLNPYELFGSYITNNVKADFTSTNYGQFYSGAFNATSPDTAVRRYYDLAMINAAMCWSNSFYFVSGNGHHWVFSIDTNNAWTSYLPTVVGGVFPVIRLKKPKIPKIVSWSEGTDQEIADLVEAADKGYIDLYTDAGWRVGDERTVHLSAMSATGVGESHAAQDVTLVLMNEGGYELVTPTSGGRTQCSFIVGMKNCLAEGGYMNSTDTNSGSWNSSARRTWCNNVFRNAIPSTLRGIFKQVKVITATKYNSSTNQTTNDYFFLPAAGEVFKGDSSYGQGGTAGEQTAYSNLTEFNAMTRWTWYATTSNRIKYRSDGVQCYWWQRSPGYNSSLYFCYMASRGLPAWDRPTYGYYLSPAGCI